MAVGAVSAISGSSRQIIWKASEPVSDRVRPEPGWHRHIIAVSDLPPTRSTLAPPLAGLTCGPQVIEGLHRVGWSPVPCRKCQWCREIGPLGRRNRVPLS